MIEDWRDELLRAFVNCDRDGVRSAVRSALNGGLAPEQVLTDLLHPAFDTLGELWARGDVALTQVFVAARATEDIIADLPAQATTRRDSGPKVVLGTLLDGHSLGARLVGTFLRAAGVEVVDAGARLSPEDLVARAIADNAQVLAVSVLMLRSANRVTQVREALRQRAPQVKLVVGGAPFRADPGLARRVGADRWAPDALRAVEAIRAVADLASGRECS